MNWMLLRMTLLIMAVMGNVTGDKAKGSCGQSSMGPSDLYLNGVMNPSYMWYRVGHKIQVPVVVDPAYNYKERHIILGGLREIQSRTCIDFYVFNNTHQLNGYDWVYITKARQGCWSHIGRVGGGAQELSLGRGCVNHRTAVHEMIHALGFAHEHVRYDRDSYVHILWHNISPGRETNFAKRKTKSTDPFGPYDYASIMHYDRRAFSHNRKDTIKPLKPGAKIGVGQTMSYWDVKKLIRMYNCHPIPPQSYHHHHHYPRLIDISHTNEIGRNNYLLNPYQPEEVRFLKLDPPVSFFPSTNHLPFMDDIIPYDDDEEGIGYFLN